MAADGQSTDCQTRAVGIFYTVLGAAFSVLLIVTLVRYPLFPLRSDAEWSSMWLLTAVVDYYVMAACICGVVISTEGPCVAAIWSLLTLILGAPFACLYTAVHLFRNGSLRFRDFWYAEIATPSSGSKQLPPLTSSLLALFYVVVGVAFAGRLGWTLFTYPLIPLQSDDANWSSEWLITTIFDIYTLVVCLLGMILGTEACPASGVWTAALLVLAGPAGCAYLAQNSFRGRSLALETR